MFSIVPTISLSITLLASSIQCRSSITTTTVSRRSAALTSTADDLAQDTMPRLGAHRGHGAVGVGDAEEVEEQRQVLGELGIEEQRPPGDLLAGEPVGLAVADPEVGAHQLQHRHEGDRLAVRLGLRFEDLDSVLAAAFGEFEAEAALADARIGDDRHHAPSPRSARRKASSMVAISSLRRRSGRSLARARGRGGTGLADAAELEDPDRPAGTLDLELAEVLGLEEAGREPGRALRQVGLARLGERLHPLREADRVADRRVVAPRRRRARSPRRPPRRS